MSDIKIPGVSTADILRAEIRADANTAKRDAALKAVRELSDRALKQTLMESAAASDAAQVGIAGQPVPARPAPWANALVCIGVPSSDLLHADFAFSMSGLYMRSAQLGIRTVLANARSTYVHAGRNVCVEAAQSVNATHILFLDSDMVFPNEALGVLLQHDKPIVGATYVRRVAPHGILGSTLDGTQAVASTGLVRMAEMPTGCLLIRMDCFDKIEKPYFRHEVSEDRMIGEDILFCRTMVDMGVEIWCDMDLSMHLKHLGQQAFTIPQIYAGALEGIPRLEPKLPMPGHKQTVVTPA
jgi:hypothetical protein